MLERYRERICSFNDDIQGTGSVATAVLLSAMKIKKQKLGDQRFVMFGQGQAGLGIARQICTGLMMEGLSREEAANHIFGIDKDGLLLKGMPMSDEQQMFAKDPAFVANWHVADRSHITLLETIRNAKATVLFGVTGQSGAFNEEVLKAMGANDPQAMIMPLSNPTVKAECTPEQAVAGAGPHCLIATGSPFKPLNVNGAEKVISQCNNLYIFPGVGLGALICGTPKVTNEMFMAASQALSDLLSEEELKGGRMLPRIDKIRYVSAQVALAVAKEARRSGLGVRADDEKLLQMVMNAMWEPKYLPYRLPE
ncbi:MAG: NAD-dependent malic enzyme [bacterium ADurb.Bin431]|nr:MAG: NAD-dependent malic enzyme [bacterium ADurb.Bin431]